MRNNNQILTPLQKLLNDKQQIAADCDRSLQSLNEDFSIVQQNAMSLLLSGMSALLFPKRKKEKAAKNDNASAANESATPVNLNLGDYLSVVRSLIPTIWNMAKPIVISWGVNHFQKWLIGKFTGKKKASVKI